MSIEKFTWRLFDPYGVAVVAGSPNLYLRSVSDNRIFDWYDNTFKLSSWTTKNRLFTEIDQINLPGLYEVDLDITSFADGIYQINADYPSVYPQHSLQEFKIKSGKLIADLDSFNISKIVQTENGLTSSQATMLLEIYRIYGLDPTAPLIVTDTARSAGAINQTINNTPNSTTIQRV
jgi:hypothetical protein